jgi:hypothetical protein
MPNVRTPEEQEAEHVFRDAILHGWGVVDGETEHEREGVNFGGHYVLVQWGCGSNCMKAALIDGRDGSILALPHWPGDDASGFDVAIGPTDLRTLQFRWNSTLLGIPAIADGMTRYYSLEHGQWRFIHKVKTPEDK